MDTHFPTAHPHHHPPTPHNGQPRSSSITGRNPIQRIGNRRASFRSSSPPHLGTQSSKHTYSVASIESENPLNYSSGFYYDDEEDEPYPPSSFHLYTSRYPVIKRRSSSKHQRPSFISRLASRVKPSNNDTAHWRLPKANNTRNSRMNFHPEERSPQGFLSSEGTVSPQPSSLTSIFSDPAPSALFSPLHGTSQRGFYHRNRNTALFSPSGTFERHSSGTAESEWEDFGDTDHALDDVKRQARLSAWTTLTSGVASPVGDVSAHSPNEQDEMRDRTRDFLANLSPLALPRPESASSASFSLDRLHSVTSYPNSLFSSVAGQFSIGEWEETRHNAMRSSTELVRHSMDSANALSDLIKSLGLNDDGTEKPPPSNTENESTPEVPLHSVRNDTLFEGQQSVIPLAEEPLPPHTCPNCSTMSPSPPPTLERAPSSFTQRTYFSVHKGPEVSHRPILAIETNEFSAPMPYHPYQTRERQVFDPFGPGNESFLPDMSRSKHPKKVKRPIPARQPTGPYLEQPPPPPLDRRPSGKKGSGQAPNGYPKSPSRSVKPVPSHWPPAAPSQSRVSSQLSLAPLSPMRSTTPKSSRSDSRSNKSEKGGWSLEKWFPAPPMGKVKGAE